MILGTKTRLRSFERADLPRSVAWMNDPDVRDGIAMYWPMSLDDEVKWYEAMLQGDKHERAFALDARKEDGWQHIGSMGFRHIDWRSGQAEFGIMIGEKEYWGQGYGTDAVKTLVQFGFDELNLKRIWLRVFDFNARAIRCYEKAGFSLEGRLRQHYYHAGRYYDELIMGLLREEWRMHNNE